MIEILLFGIFTKMKVFGMLLAHQALILDLGTVHVTNRSADELWKFCIRRRVVLNKQSGSR